MPHQTSDRLESLLRRADAAAGPAPELGEDLPQRVRQVARRARRVRLGMGAMAATIVLAGGLIWLFCFNGPRGPGLGEQAGRGVGPSDAEQVAALRAEIERLDAEVASLAAAVRRMREFEADYQQLHKLRRELARVDISDKIARDVDEAVFIMIYDADLRLKEGQKESAVDIYQQVIRLFPKNRWAKVAREKLAKI